MFEKILNEFYFRFEGTDPITNDEFEFDSRFLKMAMKEKPVEKLSLIKAEELDYDGLDGALYMDNTTFSNTEIEMEFYIHKDFEMETRQCLNTLVLVNSGKINFGWDEGFYRNCRLSTNIEITEVDDDDYPYECTISFILAPYRYAVEGNKFVIDYYQFDELQTDSRFNNFYMASLPQLYITLVPLKYADKGTLDITIHNVREEVPGGDYTIKSSQTLTLYTPDTDGFRRICVDCANRYVYAVDENYGENLNYLMHMDSDFPILKPGVNVIELDPLYTDFEANFRIVPNWRTL